MPYTSQLFKVFLLLIFCGLSTATMAQSGLPGRLQFDFRHSESHTFEYRYRDSGIGIEYMYVDRPQWQLGGRFGASFKRRTDLPEEFISHWLSFDITSYQRIGENWWWFGGLGLSTGLQPTRVNYKGWIYYELDRESWPYMLLGIKRDFADHKFFIQLQSRVIPYPDIEVLEAGRVDLAIGVRIKARPLFDFDQ